MYFVGTPLPPLIIDGYNTYERWEMVPTSRLYVEPPEVKTNFIDIPGMNGGLDHTQLLTGITHYGYRKGSWEFLLIPEENWHNVYNDLSTFLHGQRRRVVLGDDPNHYYEGRLSIDDWQSNEHNSIVVINYILDPEQKDGESGEDVTYLADLAAAGRVLRKSFNAGKIIILDENNQPVVGDSSLFDDGDGIYYPGENPYDILDGDSISY